MKKTFRYLLLLGALTGFASCLDEVPYGTYSNETFYNTEADAVQSGQTLVGLRLLMSYLPAAGCALASLLLVFYPLTDRRMKHIAGKLSIRRKTEDHE